MLIKNNNNYHAMYVQAHVCGHSGTLFGKNPAVKHPQLVA